MPRTIRVLPPELTRLLYAAGNRRIVLVEGDDDKSAFDSWYSDRLSDVEFFGSGGCEMVKDLLSVALAQSTHKRVFGIIDRDWQSDADVQTLRSQNDPHLFVLTKYDLENYLLDPIALDKEVKILWKSPDPKIASANAIEARLLEICQHLCPILAANWVFHDLHPTVGIDYFDDSYYPSDRNVVVRAAATKMNCSEIDADSKITAKEAVIQQSLVDVATAFMKCKGKTVFFHFHHLYIKLRMPAHESFRMTMIRAVALNGIHPDIRDIVENHILSYP